MTQVGFFTPRYHGQANSWSQSIENLVEGYFDIGLSQKTAQVINAEKIRLCDTKSPSFSSTAFKVLTYATLIIPTLVLFVKGIFRCAHSYEIENKIPVSKLDIQSLGFKGLDIKYKLNPKDFYKGLQSYIEKAEFTLEKAINEVIQEINDNAQDNVALLNTLRPPEDIDANDETSNYLGGNQSSNTETFGSNLFFYAQKLDVVSFDKSSESWTTEWKKGGLSINEKSWLHSILQNLKEKEYINDFEQVSRGYKVTLQDDGRLSSLQQ